MSQDKEGGLIKSYGYLIAIAIILGVFYFITQNPTLNPNNPPPDMEDAKISFEVQGEEWSNPLHLVSAPYDCRMLYDDTASGIRTKSKDVVVEVDSSESMFQIRNIGKGGSYRFCSFTDYGGIVESDRFSVKRDNQSVSLNSYSGDRLSSALRFKEFYEGKLRQFRDLEVVLNYAELEPV